MAVDMAMQPSAQSPTLERALTLSRVNFESVAYVLIIVLSIVAHLWGLGNMALHHDESIHAWSSWRIYEGQKGYDCFTDGFTRAINNGTQFLQPEANRKPLGDTEELNWPTYCYDPVYHGPTIYFLTAGAYFLFGSGDWQARLPEALAGILLVISCWMLRPYLGRRGSLFAALLLAFTPSILYYTRFARHDGLMVLFEFWFIIGLMRWLDGGKRWFLYLSLVGAAWMMATHELYYMLFFMFGIFFAVRLLDETPIPRRTVTIAMSAVLGLMVLLGIVETIMVSTNHSLGGLFGTTYLSDKLIVFGGTLLTAMLMRRVWDRTPFLLPRLQYAWEKERPILWTALAIFLVNYLVLFTTFFTYPYGALHGIYAGIAYWLGSQHEFARGDQPWYYYFMLMGTYEPLGILCSIGAAIYLFTRGLFGWKFSNKAEEIAVAPAEAVIVEDKPAETKPGEGKARARTRAGRPARSTDSGIGVPFFPLLLIGWTISATILFSWAGEKMPWLVSHIALPANLVVAWVVWRLVLTVDWRAQIDRIIYIAPALSTIALVTLAVGVWRISEAYNAKENGNYLTALPSFLLAALAIAGLVALCWYKNWRSVLSLASMSIVAIFFAYTLRASWQVVYHNSDIPVDPLVYVQTAPDVPRFVNILDEMSVNMTRNHRSDDDETGSLSMPVILDNGGSDGEGSLAWPMQWYLRDFRHVNWKSSEDLRAASPATFEVDLPDGTKGLVPAIMLSKGSISDATRAFLEQNYTQPYGTGSVFNWWFPEGNKCAPQEPGYKRFYYNTWMPGTKYNGEKGCGADSNIAADLSGPWEPFISPFRLSNLEDTWKFFFYRQLPPSLALGAREMEFWVRKDLATSAASGSTTSSGTSAAGLAPAIPLMATQVISGELNRPTSLAVGPQGNIYVADTQNHRIVIFDASGKIERTIGARGSDKNQFIEPRGIAVDSQGNIYVADTWNARIVKLGPDGTWLTTWGIGEQDLGDGRKATITGGTQEANNAKPLGFFGPRGVAVDVQGNVYVADTGNKRIVVTDGIGNFRYQFGAGGASPGLFNEPTGVSVDAHGGVYVADTWNGRVQSFQIDLATGKLNTTPIATWPINGWRADTYEDPFIYTTPDGHIFASVPLQHLVTATNSNGDVTLRWGGQGTDNASLNAPSGIAGGSDGSVYVVDRDAGRILRFSLPPVRWDSPVQPSPAAGAQP